MIQELDQRTRACHVTAECADGFGQRAHLYIDAAVQAEMIDRSPAASAEYSARMCIVHHHDAAEFVGQAAELRQRA